MRQISIPPPSAALFGGMKPKASLLKSAAAPWVLSLAALALGLVMIRVGGSERETRGAATGTAAGAAVMTGAAVASGAVNQAQRSAESAAATRVNAAVTGMNAAASGTEKAISGRR